MGKRELLLIAAFLIVGAVVYQATAPPPGPNERGFSLSRIMNEVRREVAGNRASTEITRTTTHAVGPEVAEVRVIGWVAELQVVGEDRADVATSFRIRSNAYTDEEAKATADATQLVLDPAGQTITFKTTYPREGRQWGYLTLKVPSRLRVRVEGAAKTTISHVAGVEIPQGRDEVAIRHVSGPVTITARGGHLEISDSAAVKLDGRGLEVKLARIRGDAAIRMDQGGEIEATQLGGSIELESRHADVRLLGLEAARGPVRVNLTGGELRMDGLQVETRVDSRDADVEVAMSRPAAVSLFATGGEVSLSPPPGGYRFDVVVTQGRIAPDAVVETLGLERATNDQSEDTRLTGDVAGGGPTITVRSTRADLTLRDAATPAAPAPSVPTPPAPPRPPSGPAGDR